MSKASKKELASVVEFRKYLDSQEVGVKPTVHVNGANHPTAHVLVDFGSPLNPIKFSKEQLDEFGLRLRKITRDLTGRDNNIQFNTDFSNGVFWASTYSS